MPQTFRRLLQLVWITLHQPISCGLFKTSIRTIITSTREGHINHAWIWEVLMHYYNLSLNLSDIMRTSMSILFPKLIRDLAQALINIGHLGLQCIPLAHNRIWRLWVAKIPIVQWDFTRKKSSKIDSTLWIKGSIAESCDQSCDVHWEEEIRRNSICCIYQFQSKWRDVWMCARISISKIGSSMDLEDLKTIVLLSSSCDNRKRGTCFFYKHGVFQFEARICLSFSQIEP